MLIKKYIQKQWLLFFIFSLLFLFSGCGVNEAPQKDNSPSSEENQIKFKTHKPLRKIANISAKLEISGIGIYDMTVNSDDTVSANISSTVSIMPEGNYIFTITYYQGSVTLADVMTNYDIKAGSNNIDFTSLPMNYNFDDDGDGATNMDEVRAGTDPGNASPDGTIDTPAEAVTIVEGESVNFTGTGTDSKSNIPLTYLWDFGGGASNSTEENPGDVTFNTAGTYTVTFTVTDNLDQADPVPAITIVAVTVPGNLSPDGTIDTPTGEVTIAKGESVNFTGIGADPDNNNPLTYLWDFGGGAENSTEENPGDVTFNTEGTYTITFTVTDSLGQTDPMPATVTIVTVGWAAITAGGSHPALQEITNLSAKLEIFGADIYDMTVNTDSSVTTTIPSVPVGSNTFTLTYYQGDVKLAEVVTTYDVNIDDNNIDFTSDDPDTDFDDDGDGTTNLDEVKTGTYGIPTVASTSPVNGAVMVERDITITARFNEEISPATINGDNFILRDAGGNPVVGTVSFDVQSKTASFTPDSELALLEIYTAYLSSSITDPEGDALSSTTWSFSVRDGSWGDAKLIETYNAGDASSPQIAMDTNGNALAVWQQSDGTRRNIWANSYIAGSGWGSAKLIETDNTGHASSPQIAMDANGNALAVWVQSDGTLDSIWANSYVADSGWGNAKLIETNNAGRASSPQIAMDANGNALAVWVQSDGTLDNIWANSYIADSGWGNAGSIEANNAGRASAPQIVMDANGNALAVWDQHDGTRRNIWANSYIADSGWSSAGIIESDYVETVTVFSPQIAMDANGNALAVWRSVYSIWTNSYVVGSGWGSAESIETNNVLSEEFSPQIAMDANGNALAVWTWSDGTRKNIWTNRYVADSGWGSAELIEANNAESVSWWPQVAMGANGNALAVWYQHDGTLKNIWANHFE